MTPKPQLLWHWTSQARDSELVHRHRKAERPWVGIRSKSLSPLHCWHRLKKGDYAEKQNSSSSESLISGLIKYTPSPYNQAKLTAQNCVYTWAGTGRTNFRGLFLWWAFSRKGSRRLLRIAFLGVNLSCHVAFLWVIARVVFCKWLFVRGNCSFYVVYKFNKMFRQFGKIIVGFDKYFEYRHKSIPPKWDAGFIIIEESW